MPIIQKILAVLLLLSSVAFASEPPYSRNYDPKRDAFADGRAAIELASATQRNILIEVGGEWCSWCHVLDRFIHANPAILDTLRSNFVVLKINISEENDNAAFMKDMPRPLGYPHMYVASSNGSLLHSQDTAKFRKNKRYDRGLFLNFLKRWSPKP